MNNLIQFKIVKHTKKFIHKFVDKESMFHVEHESKIAYI